MLKNPRLRNTRMQAKNIKELLGAIAYTQKLINNKIDISYYIAYSLKKLSSKINLHNLIIIIPFFIKKFGSKCKLDKKFSENLN